MKSWCTPKLHFHCRLMTHRWSPHTVHRDSIKRSWYVWCTLIHQSRRGGQQGEKAEARWKGAKGDLEGKNGKVVHNWVSSDLGGMGNAAYFSDGPPCSSPGKLPPCQMTCLASDKTAHPASCWITWQVSYQTTRLASIICGWFLLIARQVALIPCRQVVWPSTFSMLTGIGCRRLKRWISHNTPPHTGDWLLWGSFYNCWLLISWPMQMLWQFWYVQDGLLMLHTVDLLLYQLKLWG